jgi:hypothetical protein
MFDLENFIMFDRNIIHVGEDPKTGNQTRLANNDKGKFLC